MKSLNNILTEGILDQSIESASNSILDENFEKISKAIHTRRWVSTKDMLLNDLQVGDWVLVGDGSSIYSGIDSSFGLHLAKIIGINRVLTVEFIKMYYDEEIRQGKVSSKCCVKVDKNTFLNKYHLKIK